MSFFYKRPRNYQDIIRCKIEDNGHYKGDTLSIEDAVSAGSGIYKIKQSYVIICTEVTPKAGGDSTKDMIITIDFVRGSTIIVTPDHYRDDVLTIIMNGDEDAFLEVNIPQQNADTIFKFSN